MIPPALLADRYTLAQTADVAGGATMAHDIFISYAHDDKPTADAVCVTLESRGFRCWIAPRDVTLSTNYASAIVSAIEQSRLLLLIVSSHSNASPHVEREVELALSKKIPTLPMFIENIEPSPAIGYFLGASQRFYALDQPLQNYLNLLAEQMSLILANGTTRPTARPIPDISFGAGRKAKPPEPPPDPAKVIPDRRDDAHHQVKRVVSPPSESDKTSDTTPRKVADPKPSPVRTPPPKGADAQAAIIAAGIAAVAFVLLMLVLLSNTNDASLPGIVVSSAVGAIMTWVLASFLIGAVLKR